MNTQVICAVLSFFGTALGTLGGIMATARLTNFRLAQLEEKVSKYNNVIERTYKLEEKTALHDEKFAVANHRIDDLERRHDT